MYQHIRFLPRRIIFLIFLGLIIVSTGFMAQFPSRQAFAASSSLAQAFDQASQRFGVPSSILKALCYMEGRLSNHGGSPSIDNGYGCMHLIKNAHGDTLDRAAKELGVSAEQLKTDLPTTIFGGADILRDYALQLSSTHRLPSNLGDWYAPIAAYSNATAHPTALMYADAVYKLLNTGFVAQAETGEMVTLAPQTVTPNTAAAAQVGEGTMLPSGCTQDNKVDYPGAIDCILDPA